MKDSLTVQSEMALEFIDRSWPEALGAGDEAVGPIASDISQVIICGCGDSHHAAVALEMAFALWSGRRVRAAPAMAAARYLVPRLNASRENVLLIGISVSGEVARTIEAVELANSFGARTLAMTGNAESSLGKAAQSTMSLRIPDVPAGPGLINYLGSLLMGFSAAYALSDDVRRDEVDRCMAEFHEIFEPWRLKEHDRCQTFAEKEGGAHPVVFLGSGPAFGMALFAAAKLVEAAGVPAWGQDVEEWAHIEYFSEPANLPTWLLSSGGRSLSREDEIASAAQAIGRNWISSKWTGHLHWTSEMREALSPLALWAGPAGYAGRCAEMLGVKAFRGFGGGRSMEEGGGASRIRSSRRLRSKKDLLG